MVWVALAVGALAALLGNYAPPEKVLAVCTLLLVAVALTSLLPFTLYLLPLAIVLSPRVSVGILAFGRSVDLRLEDLIVVILGLWWLASRRRIGTTRWTFLVPAIAYVLITTLSTSYGSLTGLVLGPRGLFYELKEVEYLLIAVAVSDLIASRRQASVLVAGLIGLSLLVQAWGWYQTVTHHYFSEQAGRAAMPFDTGVLAMGAFSMQMALLSGTLALSLSSRRLKATLWLTAVLNAFGIVLAASRAALVGLAVAAVLVAWVRGGRKVVAASVLAGTLGLTAALAVFPTSTFSERTSATLLALSRGDIQNTFGARAEFMWPAYANLWLEHPILGAGKSAVPEVTVDLLPRDTQGVSTSTTYVAVADNNYLRFMAEGGILGLATFLWLLLSIFRTALLQHRLAHDRLSTGLSLAILAILAAMTAAAWFTDLFVVVRVAGPFWLLVGLWCALCVPESGGAAEVST